MNQCGINTSSFLLLTFREVINNKDGTVLEGRHWLNLTCSDMLHCHVLHVQVGQGRITQELIGCLVVGLGGKKKHLSLSGGRHV